MTEGGGSRKKGKEGGRVTSHVFVALHLEEMLHDKSVILCYSHCDNRSSEYIYE